MEYDCAIRIKRVVLVIKELSLNPMLRIDRIKRSYKLPQPSIGVLASDSKPQLVPIVPSELGDLFNPNDIDRCQGLDLYSLVKPFCNAS